MISTYSRVLSAIEKVLQELIEKYRGVRKSLWNLVKDQERNIVQLERIGATVEQRSKSGPRESQEKGTLLSTFY